MLSVTTSYASPAYNICLTFQNGNCKVDKVPVKELTYEEIRNKKLDFARGHDIGMH